MTKTIGKEKASEKLSDIMTLNNGRAAHSLRSWPFAEDLLGRKAVGKKGGFG